MNTLFTAEFFTQNRQRLLRMLSEEVLVVITAHGTMQRSGDTTFPFSQDRNFWYVTGINEPDILLVLDTNHEFLVLPPHNDTREIFDGAIDVNRLKQVSGIQTVYSYREGLDAIQTLQKNNPRIATLMPGPLYEPHHAMFLNPARRKLLQQLRRRSGKNSFRDLRAEFTSLRVRKQPVEINALRAAINITCNTFEKLRNTETLTSFQYEYELEAMISHEFKMRGASGHAYSPIVASGKNATTLHYIANDDSLQPGNLTIVDVGAEIEGYAADMTRTISSTPLTSRQNDVVNAVMYVQDFALTMLKPGTLLKEYELHVMNMMGDALHTLGLIVNPRDETAIRVYFPHATSHFLGLDVHDVGTYDKPLEAGMVLTCEPGIYIHDESIGVRIEDNILITADGHENLSAHCAREAYVL